MITKKKVLETLQSHLHENEVIETSTMTYYKAESGLSGLAGNGSALSTPVRGVLASTNQRLLFYGELSKSFPLFLEMNYKEITSIKETNIIFALFKKIPVVVVSHKEKETFSSQGFPEEHAKLVLFLKEVEEKHLTHLKKVL
ncbi:hypothetical protein [Fictibacillus barbaricus]|uniref:GRAM domain-containing protein n=1 Tax=Fictibacillus barbaricus TaxID=182136 RepID=A0ABU1TWG2_9BACL|nr:hypothetical protein [Fictibacillus barbaricus]MDR7071547.1 hypothetical protein [Fictibacillus barbaricus]